MSLVVILNTKIFSCRLLPRTAVTELAQIMDLIVPKVGHTELCVHDFTVVATWQE